jgi:capsular polysaccharide biosynthesis protein
MQQNPNLKIEGGADETMGREYEIDIFDLRVIFNILFKHIKLIVALTLLSLVFTTVVTFFIMTPMYETFTTLMLGRPADYRTDVGITMQDLQLNRQLVNTYAEIAKTNNVVNRVAKEWGGGMTPLYIRNHIKVTLLNNTELIKVTAKDTQPERAAELANLMAATFMEEVADIMKIENIQIIDMAEVPLEPVSPSVVLNFAVGGMLGLLLGVFLAIIIEKLDQSIKTSEDAQYLLDLPVLGMIPEITKGR